MSALERADEMLERAARLESEAKSLRYSADWNRGTKVNGVHIYEPPPKVAELEAQAIAKEQLAADLRVGARRIIREGA